jgi:hypothetical protein
LGGEDELVSKLRRKDASYGEHPVPFRFCLKQWSMGRQFMMNCKYGVVRLIVSRFVNLSEMRYELTSLSLQFQLQYVLVKVIATIIIIPLQAKGLYESGEWSWNSSYAYIAVIMNISIASALYCLVKLYYAVKDDLKEWNPLGKFLCIKGIIFFTFWQGFAIQVLCSAGVIKGIGDWDPQHVVDGITVSFHLTCLLLDELFNTKHCSLSHILHRTFLFALRWYFLP